MSKDIMKLDDIIECLESELAYLELHPYAERVGYEEKALRIREVLSSKSIDKDETYNLLTDCPGCEYC